MFSTCFLGISVANPGRIILTLQTFECKHFFNTFKRCTLRTLKCLALKNRKAPDICWLSTPKLSLCLRVKEREERDRPCFRLHLIFSVTVVRCAVRNLLAVWQADVTRC